LHSAAVSIALLSPAQAQQSEVAPSLDGALVSMNEVWNSFPDFVCKERIVSRISANGKLKEERVIESDFIAQRKTETRGDDTNRYSIVESRTVTAINGKAAKKGAKPPSAPLLFDGLAANILFISDLPTYKTGHAMDLDSRLSVRIAFSIQDVQQFLQLEFPAAVAGLQLDTGSSKTLHVVGRLRSLHAGGGIPVSADFQSIQIDQNAYWLPRLVKAEALTDRNEAATYVAEYTDCRKFEVTVKIRPVSAVP
jgi:hypothetical protein